jgi:hypothetical protein
MQKSARGSKKIGATTLSITRLNTIIFSITKKKMRHSAWLSVKMLIVSHEAFLLSVDMLSVVSPKHMEQEVESLKCSVLR